jgi:cell division protein ZipA
MDDFRWILLAIGIAFVIAIYLWSRSRKNNTEFSSYQHTNDAPSFSATEDNNEWVDGVGPVRVVKSFDADEMDSFNAGDSAPAQPQPTLQKEDVKPVVVNQAQTSAPVENTQEQVVEKKPEPEQPRSETNEPEKPSVDDVVVLYLVAAHGTELKGEQILSATYATQLQYGDMKIFHRKDANDKTLFSMTNMMEPGWFEFDKMHEMKTRGISLFVQLSLCSDPVKTLDDMLVCAHTLSSMLSAQLCDQNRQKLNESFTTALREKAKRFV